MSSPAYVYDGGDFGHVVFDRARESFVLTCRGSMADPRHRDMMVSALDGVLEHHPRYFVSDLSHARGTADAADMELLRSRLPAIIAGGTSVLVTIPPLSAIAGLSANRLVVAATDGGSIVVTAASIAEALAWVDADRAAWSNIA